MMRSKEKKSKEEIETEVRRHLAAEKKAYIWVERLALVDKIDQEECNIMLNSIMVAHYCDLVEERSISNVCGYPICSNPILQKYKQKYHISLKEQRVYDTSERKCFCSDFCYKASKYIKAQISESPIWLRTTMKVTQFLEKENRGKYEKSMEEHDKDEENGCSNDIIKESYKRYDQFETVEKAQENVTPIKATPPEEEMSNTSNTENEKDQPINMLRNLKVVLEEWLKDTSITMIKDVDETAKNNEQPVNADVSFQIKALNFLSNNPEWITESKMSDNFNEKIKIKSVDKEHRSMPHIHSKSQVSMRRKIVKDQIYNALGKLYPVLEVTSVLAETDFFKFVNSFSFTSRNIVLKRKEWMLATISLMHIHSWKRCELREVLESKEDELNKFLKQSEMSTFNDLKVLCEEISKRKEKRSLQKSSTDISITDKFSRLSTNKSDSDDEDFFDMISGSDGKEFDMEELD